MITIETSFDTTASPEQVWKVLLDFDRYPDWNPLIRSAVGTGAVGTKLTNHLHLKDMKPQVFKPTVLVHELHTEFRWLGSMFIRRVFDGEHFFKLSPRADGGTHVIHGEKFRGMLAGLIMKKIGKATEEGFLAMNESWKREAERT